ncbi:MAG: hydroxymethylglutaryl-CoA lyase [Bdellovibrionales bacterium RIFOXYD12_FULL_39_22]|nr:MAG: hydroxymethylglutaryl-CoA lyase [Bdellovibrionales bacterium RIFOXYB1_FULL_39_21]OFZ42736.1 MAG: hydroxymethylglutaryl-CoA lyase [Bdellovibrionales bacterium RIFOXYC12_FULL_39_17]OFZ47295.1 MAG: hydroxymethylglutaryl-CoA lyase [Bdellovibrionales bacterium RIFOXYC1_FULL_39_130]OFZ71425.1 MAG: hydroxymethylglutaryl-CoA lyase [Bdellovibrionales bacterium RIFOXYC2_FULL_39_8]OFZ75461.1 MAG: hydroxymethylglutaryl-CoA lyase [Bdellovibrionales bacterium RIFOXYD1_FULL_39_84]OFZ93415.1 MAG: hydr
MSSGTARPVKFSLPRKVKIIEVGPRDGLQNESLLLSSEDKFNYISLLVAAGLKNIEVTSFVRPDRVPQMADAAYLLAKLQSAFGNSINLPVLIPNAKGMQAAIASKVSEVAIFTATSESFNRHNINASIDESFTRFIPITQLAKKHRCKVRGYISTVFGCPYEGKTKISTLKKVIKKLFTLGAYEISLGDTIGVATPMEVNKLLNELKLNFDLAKFAMHFHDSRGQALANVFVSLQHGISKFDSSSGGLGGCPYAPGAPGNLATEDLVFMLESSKINTGVDLNKLAVASRFILNKLGKATTSKCLATINAKK